jgi:hypothetical protein
MSGYGVCCQLRDKGTEVIAAFDNILDHKEGFLQQFEYSVDGGFAEIALPGNIAYLVDIVTQADEDFSSMGYGTGSLLCLFREYCRNTRLHGQGALLPETLSFVKYVFPDFIVY